MQMFSSSTKKTYRGQNKRRAQFSLSVIALCGVVAVFAVLQWIVPGSLYRAASFVATPVWVSGSVAAGWGSGFVAQFQNTATLAAENKALRERIAILEEQNLDRAILAEQNIVLKEMLGRIGTRASSTLAAVVRRPPIVPYDTFIVDIGANTHISVGDFVQTRGGTRIGSVQTVGTHTAQVQLLSAPGTENQVAVGPDRIPGTAVGRGSGNFKIELPKGAAVKVGDAVTLVGGEPVIIGVVGEVGTTPADAFQTIYFQVPHNIHTLTWVEIVHTQ